MYGENPSEYKWIKPSILCFNILNQGESDATKAVTLNVSNNTLVNVYNDLLVFTCIAGTS